MKTILREELRQKTAALLGVHRMIEQAVGEARSCRERGREIRVAGSEFLGNEAGRQIVGAGAAQFLRKPQRAQPHLRRLVEELERQLPVARLQACRPDCNGLDLAGNKIAHGVADFQLFRGEMKIVHLGRRLSLRRNLSLGDGSIIPRIRAHVDVPGWQAGSMTLMHCCICRFDMPGELLDVEQGCREPVLRQLLPDLLQLLRI